MQVCQPLSIHGSICPISNEWTRTFNTAWERANCWTTETARCCIIHDHTCCEVGNFFGPDQVDCRDPAQLVHRNSG